MALQISLHPQDKEKTAFGTLKSLLHFTTMALGLHGAATTFQCLVDTVLSPTYLDDIVVYGKTWEEHLQHLWCIFQRLHIARIWINLKKSKEGFKELDYLGYMVGGGQLRPQKWKVDAIVVANKPRTKKQLQHLLGLVGYYNRFIWGYETIAAPLTDHLAKRHLDTLQWDLLVAHAFEALRHALVRP